MKQNRGYCALFASLLAVLIALQFAPPAWSADVGSRLRCTVTDESKAFVSGARLTLTDANNKFTAEGTSNDHGEYTFINLPPATYRLKVERDGFSPKLADDITLDLIEVRVLNIHLGGGEEREVLEFTGPTGRIVLTTTFILSMLIPLSLETHLLMGT